MIFTIDDAIEGQFNVSTIKSTSFSESHIVLLSKLRSLGGGHLTLSLQVALVPRKYSLKITQ